MKYLPPKYGLPAIYHPAVDRSSLLAQLAQVFQHKLTLVAGPPGYGKTTLIAQFAYQVSAPVAWHTVEERERDYPSLLVHCQEILSNVVADLDIQPSGTPAASAALIADQLRNSLSVDMIYVLDDVQNILGSPDAELWLQTLIERIPPRVHLILIGRALPVLPVMELVARRELLTIGQGQLRFSFQEIQTLAQQMDARAERQEIQRIVNRFDGWAAGSVLALQLLPTDIASAFFGEQQAPEAMFDALAETLLHAQDQPLQGFLLDSSTLPRMTPTLCQRVLYLADSQAHVEELLHRHLFVSEVPAGMMYHSLFRRFLQTYLKANDPTRFAELHLRAAHWSEDHDQLELAFDHYISAGRLHEAGAIAERVAGAYLSQGKSETVLYWRDELDEAGAQFPQLLFICGSIRVYRYQYALARDDLADAEETFQSRGDRLGVVKVKLAQANLDNLRGEPQQAVDLTETVLQQFDIPSNLRGYAHSILGRAYRALGNIGAALDHLEAALPLYRETGDQYAVGHLLLALEHAHMRMGRFEEASTFLQEALALLRAVGNELDLLAPLSNLGTDYHLLGNYAEAQRTFQEGMEIASRVSENRWDGYLYGGLADLSRDRGDFDEAILLYRKALSSIGGHEPALRCTTLVSFATLRRWQGNLDEAWALATEANELAQDHALPFERLSAQLHLSAIRIQQNETNADQEMLEVAEALRRAIAPTQWAQAVILRAYSALLRGDTFSAHNHLKAVVDGVVHETNLQPGAAEIVHTPLLKSFVQLHRLRYPALMESVTRLEAALTEHADREDVPRKSTRTSTYSLRLRTLGQEQVERDGVSVPISAWRAMDARELFFYLLLKGATSREQLGLVLWEDSSQEQVRGKFHATLRRARNAVGDNTIHFEDETYTIDPNVDIWCDATEFRALVEKARLSSSLRSYTEDLWRRAVSLYGGELLPSIGAAWIVPLRERLHQMYLEALLALGTCIRTRGAYPEALATFRKALDVDPYCEDVYREMMRCYAALGERASIQREMDTLTQLLDAELGIAPSTETLSLAQSLLNS